jgi:hypothetical protein
MFNFESIKKYFIFNVFIKIFWVRYLIYTKMKYLKNIEDFIRVFENIQNEVFELIFYSVTFHTSNTSDNIYFGIDYQKALSEFNNPDIPDEWKTRNDMSVEISKILYKYKFIYELDEEYESITDYPIETYHNDEDYYEKINESESEYETIDSKEISSINVKANEILNDVQNYFYKKYGNYKYNIIDILDNEHEYLGRIKLRITNHTENIMNIDRFEKANYHVSVVISDYDETEKRFGMTNAFERRRNEFEMKYNSDYTPEEIIEEINFKIEELTDEIKDKN